MLRGGASFMRPLACGWLIKATLYVAPRVCVCVAGVWHSMLHDTDDVFVAFSTLHASYADAM